MKSVIPTKPPRRSNHTRLYDNQHMIYPRVIRYSCEVPVYTHTHDILSRKSPQKAKAKQPVRRTTQRSPRSTIIIIGRRYLGVYIHWRKTTKKEKQKEGKKHIPCT